MAMNWSRNHTPNRWAISLFQRADTFQTKIDKIYEEGAEAIKDQSVSNSPIDEGDLEASHRVVQRPTRAGNIAWDVVVGGEGPVTGKDVDQYIVFMHDRWDWNPGPKSQMKINSGHDVGPKFLERAFLMLKPIIVSRIKLAMKESF